MKCFVFHIFGLVILALNAASADKLTVSGTDLTYDGQKVYLHGANLAWNSYGYDFGNGNYDGTIETWISEIKAAGGNSIRVWVHVEGESTPVFDVNGYVTKCDNTGDLIDDVRSMLDAALRNHVLVILVLWNGAAINNQKYIDLIWDDAKLNSYFDNCLVDLASAVQGHPALAAWEAMNEPEGSVQPEANDDPCYDTTFIGKAGAGWSKANIPMQRLLRFVGRHNQVLKTADPTTLTTLGSWSQFSQTDAFDNTFNHYSDACLERAAGGANAGIDLQQMHVYTAADSDGNIAWSENAPFTVSAWAYDLDKPLMLGEFSSDCGLDTPLRQLIQYAYDNGYNGGQTWHWIETGLCTDSKDVQRDALSQLSGQTSHGVVDFTIYWSK